jgi:3-oxoacyl-[acyl-carrier protein] reductase
MFTSIAGQSVIVTGGSKGIGKGIARVFAAKGAKIVVAARGLEDAEATAKEIRYAGGVAIAHAADVSNWESVQGLVATAIETFGTVDILCANAGVFPQKKIVDLSPDEWDQVQSTNLKSTFLCVKACIPVFEKAGKGRVVVTSSITGPITGYPGWSHYGASKAGQLGFLRTAAMELARYNTTINAVLPGNIITEGLQDLGQSYLDGMAKAIPLKRLGKVEDIGHAALFLATQEASYITGQTIIVDGGQILPESAEAIDSI